MDNNKNIVVGFSVGDLNGVGLEIILSIFEDKRMLEFCTPVIFGSQKSLNYVKKHFNFSMQFFYAKSLDQISDNKINVIASYKDDFEINFGEENHRVGQVAVESFVDATNALKQDKIDVLVTAPINKYNIQSDAFKFPGHTNYLNEQLEGKALMFMINDGLRVGLLTDHVPVKDVSNHITSELIQDKIKTVYNSLQADFQISKPKIAVLGINPHNGDNGVIGKEDDEVLRPTLEKIKAEGKLVYGPYAADSFFGSDNYKNFDAVIASYHDQGLIPFKTLSFGEGVNYTAGLDKVRTSPDHGTAYDIAGKGLANVNSLKKAIFDGIKIYNNRIEYGQLTADPLKTGKKKI
tara:strand:- start:908 stop:1954 length:1047 start_codon:yes stop_codon:yes gene_type:complete